MGCVKRRTCARAHLDVHPVEGGQFCAVDPAPVRDDEAFETPFVLEDLVQQGIILAAVLAAEPVVGPHDAQGAGFPHGRAEGRQVNLAQGPLVHLDVDPPALNLLVVGRIMLGATGDALRLLALDVADGNAGGEERVLAHILEVAAAQRRAHDVQAGPEHDVLAALLCLLADHRAIFHGQVRVKRGGQAEGRGHGSREIVRAVHVPPAVAHLLPHAHRTVVHP